MMRKLAIGVVTVCALIAAAPAMAQLGVYAGPGGIGVGVGPFGIGVGPGPYYYGGPYYAVPYYGHAPDWYGGPNRWHHHYHHR